MFSLAKSQWVRNFPVFLLWSISHLITPPSPPPPRGKRTENVSVPVSTFEHYLSLTFSPKYFTFFSFFPKHQLKQMNIPKLSLDLIQINMQHFTRRASFQHLAAWRTRFQHLVVQNPRAKTNAAFQNMTQIKQCLIRVPAASTCNTTQRSPTFQ